MHDEREWQDGRDGQEHRAGMSQRVTFGVRSSENLELRTSNRRPSHPSRVARAAILRGSIFYILGRGIEVNRLKRGGSLFEGIARREMEEYTIRTRCARN